MEAVMKRTLLVTMIGAFMLMQAPFAFSEDEPKEEAPAAASEPAAEPAKAAEEAKPAEPAIGKAVQVASLRGKNDLDKEAKAIEKKKQFKSGDGIERNWELQPPSIPHDIAKERITLKGNSCMKCHSKDNHEKEKAPEVSKSHYVTRDMKVLDKLSSRRYFCNQCHTPQADVDPLVENSFEANSIKLNNLLMDKTGK
jgi:cytochrome c-type protein NapB